MTEQPNNHGRLKGPDLKVKTAVAATVMNILLTGIKFLLYFFSGSMAILAEAWHSFADIATSCLVFVAVRQSSLKARNNAEESLDGFEADSQKSLSGIEMLISLGIGILLTILAGFLLKKCIYSESLPIRNPVVSGILFLVFSLGSYFIYRFETQIGEKEGSIGLVSDGLHARADMTASLLVGFSLILYAMGLNFDRWVAGVIALFIFSFAMETIVNVALIYFRRESDFLFQHRFSKITALLIDRASIQKATSMLKAVFENKFGRTKIMRMTYTTILYLPFILVLVIYLSTSIFKVGAREQAVIERLGRPLSLKKPVEPGLHLKLPWPLDCVRKV